MKAPCVTTSVDAAVEKMSASLTAAEMALSVENKIDILFFDASVEFSP